MMIKRHFSMALKTAAFLSISFATMNANAFADTKLKQVIAGEHRTESYAARDKYRHPQETLEFFGIRDDMTVVEISPGGGWYSEILAPYLKENGLYIAAGYDPKSDMEYFANNAKKYAKKLADNPAIYGKTKLSIMQAPDHLDFAKPASADMVLTFRNTHNWHSRGHSEAVFKAIFKALKPGGVLGLVQHRAGHKYPEDTSGKFGYLKESDVIKLAESVGFKLVAKSDINANPKDQRNYEKGVWTLPPVYSLGEKDKAKYAAIGESDRMTLKFAKPAAK